MTKAKENSGYMRGQPLLGPSFKVCLTCGKRIERDGMPNAKWLRKAYCNRACHYAGINQSSWKRRRFVDG